MSGFQLSTQSAQRIVAEIGGIVGQNINMMDAQGYIIASTDPARIGFLHEGARQIIEERLPELYIRAEEATATARTGLNLLAALCRGRRLRNAALLSASISPSHGASW